MFGEINDIGRSQNVFPHCLHSCKIFGSRRFVGLRYANPTYRIELVPVFSINRHRLSWFLPLLLFFPPLVDYVTHFVLLRVHAESSALQ